MRGRDQKRGQLFDNGAMFVPGIAIVVPVESLLRPGWDTDMQEAAAAIERLAAVTTYEDLLIREIWLLRMRALLARAEGDEPATATIGIATATWRRRWASRDT